METITHKYIFSEKYYKTNVTSVNQFLNIHDELNIYGTYPQPIVVKLRSNNDIKYGDYKLPDTYDNIFHKIFKKLDEMKDSGNTSDKELFTKYKKNMIRKYFDYDVLDHVKEKLDLPIITRAWLKCWELLFELDLINLSTKKDLKTFHVCELPGAFIMCVQKYVEGKRDLDWRAQSLNPWVARDKKKFLTDQYDMAKKNKDRYDWGTDGTGDITNIDNILHYHKKYKCELFTSDCGQDSSDDFSKQEKRLNKIAWSQYVTMLGTLEKGGNYIAKIFTCQTKDMIGLIYSCSTFFDETYLVKPLKTRQTSGEKYIVAKGFRGCDDINFYINHLRNFGEHINVPSDFIKELNKSNSLFGLRRITAMNKAIFMNVNVKFIAMNGAIGDRIKKIRDYYVNYYHDYFFS